MAENEPKSNIVNLFTRQTPEEEAERQTEVAAFLKTECLGVIDDLRSRIDRGEIDCFAFIGFSPDGFQDVVVFTTGTMRRPAHTVGAMEMHKNAFMNDVEREFFGGDEYED